MAGIYYIDGKFVSAREATLPVNDMAILRGYGVFDFLRTYGGKPFHLKDHLKRLSHSAQSIGLELPWSISQITEIVMETLRKNGYKESNIRVVVTGGHTEDYIMPAGMPRLLVMVTPVHEYPERWYKDGVKIITIPVERHVPGAKSLNYLSAILALKKAYSEKAVEVVYTDRGGKVKEGTTSNFFAFRGDTLITPGTEEILPGITRQVVLELAKKEFEVQIRDLYLKELPQIDEAFISASNKQVVPVIRINDLTLADGKPGSRTHSIMKRFGEYTQNFGRGKVPEK